MNNSFPRPCGKPVARATADRDIEAVLEEVCQLRVTMAVYREIVDELREEKAA